MVSQDMSRRTLLKGGGAALAGLTTLQVAGPASASPGEARTLAAGTGADLVAAPADTDDTANVQAAITAAGGSGEIILGPGTWALNLGTIGSSTAGAGVNLRIRGAGPYDTILKPVSSAAGIFKLLGPGDSSSDYFELDDLGVCLPFDMAYDVPLIEVALQKGMIRIGSGVRFYAGDPDVPKTTANYTGTMLKLDGSYEGTIDAKFRVRKYAVPLEFVNVTELPSLAVPPNLDCLRISGTINGVNGHIFRDAHADIHGLHFERYKITSTVDYPVPPFGEATIDVAPSPGATAIVVTSAMVAGVMPVAGDAIGIDAGNAYEVNKVMNVAINTPGAGQTTLTLAQPLRYTHPTTRTVITGGKALSFGKRYNAVQFSAFHFEGFYIGVSADDGRGFHMLSGYSNCSELFRLEGETRGVVLGPAITSCGTPNLHVGIKKATYNTAAAGTFGDHIVYPLHDPNPLPGYFITPTAVYNSGNDFHVVVRNRTAGAGAMTYTAASNTGTRERITPAFRTQYGGTEGASITHSGKGRFTGGVVTCNIDTTGLTSAQIDTAVNTAASGSGSPATNQYEDGLVISDTTNFLLLVRQAGKWYKTAVLTQIE